MPGFRIPQKSGIHRFDTCALFRTLLRRTRHKAIPENDQIVLRIAIKDKFHKSHRAQGHYIHDAVKLAHKTLHCFNTLRNSEVLTKPVSRLCALVNQLYPPKKLDKIAIERLQPRLEYEERLARRAAREEARKSPKKNWHVYDRPMPKELLTGRRKIPNYVVASGVPFLRYAKPQPPELSGMIRHKIKRKHNLMMAKQTLEGQAKQEAAAEDRWEKALQGICGLPYETSRSRYSDSVSEGLNYIQEELGRIDAERLERGKKLFAIHLKEKALAMEENAELREQRKREQEQAKEEELGKGQEAALAVPAARASIDSA